MLDNQLVGMHVGKSSLLLIIKMDLKLPESYKSDFQRKNHIKSVKNLSVMVEKKTFSLNFLCTCYSQ